MLYALLIILAVAIGLAIALYFQMKASQKQADEQKKLLDDYQQRVNEQQKLLDDYRALEKNFDSVGEGYEQALLAFEKMEEEQAKSKQLNETLEKRCGALQDQVTRYEEFAQKCDCFITNEAKLTPQEAQKFLPLYHAMKDAQRKLMQEKGQLMREAMKDESNDKQNLKTLERIIAIDRQVVDIEHDYQKKMLKVLSPSKLLKVKMAEKKFERQMLHNMAPRHKRGGKIRK